MAGARFRFTALLVAMAPALGAFMRVSLAARPMAALRSSPLLAASMSSASAPTTGDYSIADVLRRVRAGEAQLLDVREADEWDAGHLALATLAPLSALQTGVLPAGVSVAGKQTLYVHCKAGGRAQKALALLRQLGGEDVVALSEGYAALVDSGFPKA
ncbi:Rhodanese-like domain-containing protein [Pavlovales sp. CCMP2436]|nr:Rhodanese-like domain-containing protein [Pavlovales sp. CCMP2436]